MTDITQNESSNGGFDPAELKRAYAAFKKRLKLQRLDDNSTLGRSPLSGGERGLTAVTPPNQYPQEIWNELARQGKIRSVGQGLYELPRRP